MLSPKLHPDPCADVVVEIDQVSWRAPVTASASEAEKYGPQNLTDSNPESYWSAGNGVPQWFEIDLGSPVAPGTFRLPIGIVTPDGHVVIEVEGSGPDGARVLLHTFDEDIAPGDVLEHTLESSVDGIQTVRFTVKTMRDWVIFHDVEVFRAR
ncbi:MAG: discoidin domain-containing protein [Acidimicrobiia bacterium]